MRRFLACLPPLLPVVHATWQVVYNVNYTIAFIQSTNGSLYQLNIGNGSITAQGILANLTEIAQPPSANASLVVDAADNLYAVWGTSCASGPLQVSRFDHVKQQWVTKAQSNTQTQNWYLDDQVVWMDLPTNQIYVYGGSCDGQVFGNFYTYNVTGNTFQNVTSEFSIMPRKMAMAQTVALDQYRTLVLGGHNGNAWMSMQQLAIFGYGSWSFVSVGNSSDIDSRDDPLLLPLWQDSESSVSQILVIGGTVAGRQANPPIAVLSVSDEQGWQFSVPNEDSNIDFSYAGFSIYDTLISLTDSDQEGLSVELYDKSATDSNSWTSVTQAAAPTSTVGASSKESSKTTPTAVIAVVSTLLPLIALAIVGILVWWWLRKRRERRLFLLPNKRSMMREAPAMSFGSRPEWVDGDLYRLPSSSTAATYQTRRSNKSSTYYPKQRGGGLHVVNPDTNHGISDSDAEHQIDMANLDRTESDWRTIDSASTSSSRSSSSSDSRFSMDSRSTGLSSETEAQLRRLADLASNFDFTERD